MRNIRHIFDNIIPVSALTFLIVCITGCVEQDTEERIITNISDIISPDVKPEIEKPEHVRLCEDEPRESQW